MHPIIPRLTEKPPERVAAGDHPLHLVGHFAPEPDVTLRIVIGFEQSHQLGVHVPKERRLRLPTDTRNREKHVDRRSAAYGKQLTVKKYVPVGHTHHIGLDVTGEIPTHTFHNRQAGDGNIILIFYKAPCPLEDR